MPDVVPEVVCVVVPVVDLVVVGLVVADVDPVVVGVVVGQGIRTRPNEMSASA